MSTNRLTWALVVVFFCASKALSEDMPLVNSGEIREAVTKSLAMIQKSTAEYRRQRSCFSCHHQTLPILTIAAAKTRGYEIDEEDLQAQLERTLTHLRRGRDRYLKGRGQGGRVDTAVMGLLALQAGKNKPDDTTAAVVEYLLLTDKSLDHWRGTSSRPPTQASDITRTAVALSALRTFGTKEQQERIAERTMNVKKWLLTVEAKDTEDRVSQLRALTDFDEKVKLKSLAGQLVKDQQADGGWAQKSDMKSDAYATGAVLVALLKAGEVAVRDEVYQRGLRFLLKAQLDDGSWHVQTRSKAFQKYFESGFPHGKDQFVSISTSCWATMALILASPPVDDE